VKRSASPNETVHIREWERKALPQAGLTSEDRRIIERFREEDGHRLDFDEFRGEWRVLAKSWVGVVRLESLEIRIEPKLAGGQLTLLDMIDFTSGVDVLRRCPGLRSLDAQGASLFDLLVMVLCEETRRIVRGGLLRDYVERTEALPFVRGRILVDRQVLERFGRVDRVICRHDDHSHDVVENRILAAALSVSARRARDARVKASARRLAILLENLCELDDPGTLPRPQGVDYHRLNEHYRDAHRVAYWILEGLALEDLFCSSEARCFAFLIDMNRLFEAFVTKFLEWVVPAGFGRVRPQRSDASILWNVTAGRSYSSVRPDMIVDCVGETRKLVPVEVKYKLFDERKIDAADVYQAFVYAYAYRSVAENDHGRALLVYPGSTSESSATSLRVRSGGTRKGAEILAIPLSVPEALREAKARRPGGTAKVLLEAVEWAGKMAGG